MKKSIRIRVVAAVLAVVLPLAIASGVMLVRAFGERLLREIDMSLEEEAETIAGLATTDPRLPSLAAAVRDIAVEKDFGARYIVVTRAGRVLAEEPAGAASHLGSSPEPRLRIVRFHSAAADVAIGIDAAVAVREKQRLTWLVASGLPVVLLLLGTGVWIVVGRALQPLELAAERLPSIGAENLSIRVPVGNPDDEVGRMTTALNAMLDRLARAVGELHRFTADAAHEVRTPLTVLRTGLELALGKDRSAEEYREALADALAATDRLCSLAEDLLTLARLEAGGARAPQASVDVADMLHEVADAWTESAQERGAEVRVVVEAPLAIRGHAGDLYRLFDNLVANAIRHGAAGGRIQLSATRVGDRIAVAVADDGPGIAAEDCERIFERFHRGRADADRCGTGLGLSIARQIARQHGGDITVASRPEAGTTFTVTLPSSEPC